MLPFVYELLQKFAHLFAKETHCLVLESTEKATITVNHALVCSSRKITAAKPARVTFGLWASSQLRH